MHIRPLLMIDDTTIFDVKLISLRLAYCYCMILLSMRELLINLHPPKTGSKLTRITLLTETDTFSPDVFAIYKIIVLLFINKG